MRCQQIATYLPGYAADDLRAETRALVTDHLADCGTCSAEIAMFERVGLGLASLSERVIEPTAFLADAIVEGIHPHRGRRIVAIPPIPPEALRLVAENKEAIASAAGAAVVAAGAAWAIARLVRGARVPRPAGS